MSSRIFINPHQKPISSLPPANSEIRQYHQSLPDYKITPLHTLSQVAKHIGVNQVLLKDESFRLGLPAFKILGASWATAQAILQKLSITSGAAVPEEEEEVENGDVISLSLLANRAQRVELVLFAATDGNHGRAVARMARVLGIQARIYVPKILDEEAKGKIASEGTTVVVFDGDYDQTVLGTKKACEEWSGGKGLLISDTALVEGDHVAGWIVDGYQTMFDEIEEQIREVVPNGKKITHVITPVGVGSLSQAVVTHFFRDSERERPVIVTVEPDVAACFKASLQAGRMVSVKTGYTICSGLCCGTLSMNGWPLLKDSVTAAVTIDDIMADEAVKDLESYGIHAGPCGAATLAGLKCISADGDARLGLGPDAVVLIICTEGVRGYTLEM